jgi:arylsulfatase A-like enzyme/Flp pilus assembly protein TadD
MGTSRCRWVLAALLVLGCHREHPKYNVLLITLDTFRADRLGPLTPALAKLARDGAAFTNADSPVPLTLPAHSSLLSGVLPPHHGLRNNGAGSFPAERETLATALSAKGYRTGAFVSSFVLDRRFGLNRGFDVYDDEVARDPTQGANLEAERRGGETVDRALSWLGQADARPFFAWVHLYDAHAPYAPPAPYPRTYDGEIAYVDAQVARLLGAIDRGNTIVAVVGDHGESLGEHGELTHGLLLYEATLHVPLIVAAPEAKARTIAQAVSTVDLAPTLAALAGAALPNADGHDLFAKPSEDIYAETEYPAQFGWSDLTSLRRGDWKLIRAPQPEVYDLGHDPGERSNQLDKQRRVYHDFGAALDAVGKTAVTAAAGVDEETRRKLASLGYVAPAHENTAKGPRPNPETMAPLFRKFEQAHLLLAGNRPAEALPVLEQLAHDDPDNAVFRATLAQAWRQQGNLQRAIELYREAAAQTPDDPEAWYNLAAAFQDAGDQEKAGTAIAEALRLDKKRPEAHNVLGIALASTGQPAAAIGEFQKAIDIDPRNARAYNNLGNVLRAMNRSDDAAQAYRKSIELAPRYPDPLNGLGTLAVQRDRPAEALPLFDKAIALAPNFFEARLNRGIALQLNGDRAGAMREYESLLRDAGSRPELAPQRAAAAQLLAKLRG